MRAIDYNVVQYPTEGDSLDVVGNTTGRHRYRVQYAMAAIPYPRDSTYMVLGGVLEGATDDGDSGGPVFRYNEAEGTVSLAGLMWGKNPVPYTFFSSFGAVSAELGGLTVMDRYANDHGPFAMIGIHANIDPPNANEETSFEPWFVGGTGPYSCTWQVNGSPISANGCSLTYTNNGSTFSVQVSMTDVNSVTRSAIQEFAPFDPCYPYDCAQIRERTAGVDLFRSVSTFPLPLSNPAQNANFPRLQLWNGTRH